MNRWGRLRPILASLLVGWWIWNANGAETPSPAWWKNLEVRSIEGRALPAPAQWVVIVFLDPECPVANGYIPVINALTTEFGGRDFVFLGAYTDSTASLERLRMHAREFKIAVPLIDDRERRFGRFAGASYSSEAVIFDAEGKMLYRGRIDNRVGENGAARPAATQHDLRDVLQRLRRGEPGPFRGERGFGCLLTAAGKTQ